MKELSLQYRLPVWVSSAEEATAALADGDPCDCLLKHCHSCVHKLISCDYTASAEIDSHKFGITMPGQCHPSVACFTLGEAPSTRSPMAAEEPGFAHSWSHPFLRKCSERSVQTIWPPALPARAPTAYQGCMSLARFHPGTYALVSELPCFQMIRGGIQW